jgi:FAD/FMN-containing dehydrogenase
VSETYARGDAGYEQARTGIVWNGRKPARYPDRIVRARTTDDVIAAVRDAAESGLEIGVRSGGHSWACSYLRDGGMLIDLSQMTDVELDVDDRTAQVEPGKIGSELGDLLKPHDLFFPTGHCMTVGIGGFLLQGGFGWNSKLLGPACASVTAVDVVTANGELVHADETQNADLFWAARGSGPGFFGVVTRFWLRLHARPRSIMRSAYVYPRECMPEVLTWANAIRAEVGPKLEAMVFLRREVTGAGNEPGLIVMGPALTDSENESREVLSILATCPALDRAVLRDEYQPVEMSDLMAGGDALLYPIGSRYETDNMWTNASSEALFPHMERIADGLPEAPSHMMWMLWGAEQELPDMAFSMQAELYIALYGIGTDLAGDGERERWVTENMRALEPHAKGIQLADENLGRRPFRFMVPENLERLQRIRAERDPERRFHSYMELPASST